MSPHDGKQMLTFVVDLDLLNEIDDYRYDNRFPTRAGAIRWLLQWAVNKAPPPARKRRGTKARGGHGA